MKVSKQLLLGSCIFALLFMLTPGARASQWDQKVIATFSGPVEIPGQVLPTGTYVFKIMNVVGTRDVVQVTNSDETKVLATAFAVARYRSTPTDKPVFVFEERGSDSPQALEAWYYPGYVDGHQFIYHKRATANILSASNISAAPAPAPTNEAATSSYTAPVESSTANSDEASISQPEPEVTADQGQVNQTPTTSTTTPDTSTDQTNKELPKTASSTPLIALIGLLSLGGAIGLKILAARVS